MSKDDDMVRVMIRCPVNGDPIPTGLMADPKRPLVSLSRATSRALRLFG